MLGALIVAYVLYSAADLALPPLRERWQVRLFSKKCAVVGTD